MQDQNHFVVNLIVRSSGKFLPRSR